MAAPVVDASIDWDAWTPGSIPAARQAAKLDELIATAVGRSNQWSDRAAQRGSLLASIEDHRLDRLAAAVTDAVARGDSADTLAKVLRDVLDDPKWAETVATTEMARAMSAASLASYTDAGLEAVEWLASPTSCEVCQENEAAGPIPMGSLFPSGDDGPPQHPRCLPGDVRVVVPGDVLHGLPLDSTPTLIGPVGDGSLRAAPAVTEAERHALRVRAATDRHYVGDLVTIRLENGYQLSGTPNHPVATRRGWVGLADLHLGDDVLYSTHPQWVRGVVPDVDDVPPLIEQVVHALPMALRPMPSAAEDFHGDGAGSDVHVVRTHRLLLDAGQASAGQQVEHPVLGLGDVLPVARPLPPESSVDQLVVAELFAPNGVVGSSGEGAPLLGRHAVHAELASLRDPARLGTNRDHVAPDHASGHAKLFSQGKLGLPSAVSGGDCLRVERLLLDPNEIPLAHRLVDTFAADTEGVSYLLDGEPGEVKFGRLVNIETAVTFSGHVFNLETGPGWYVANGIISHNCTCAVSPVVGYESPATTGETTGDLIGSILAPTPHPTAGTFHPAGTDTTSRPLSSAGLAALAFNRPKPAEPTPVPEAADVSRQSEDDLAARIAGLPPGVANLRLGPAAGLGGFRVGRRRKRTGKAAGFDAEDDEDDEVILHAIQRADRHNGRRWPNV